MTKSIPVVDGAQRPVLGGRKEGQRCNVRVTALSPQSAKQNQAEPELFARQSFWGSTVERN